MQRFRVCAVLVGFYLTTVSASADQEASNIPHIATDEYGRCFAHTVPSARYGTDGRTDVYVAGEELTLTNSYDWYAPQLHVACNISDGAGQVAPALAQLGPWPRGYRPDDETLAVAFYYNGELKARYSTKDIADSDRENVSCSVSHYTVIQAVAGFERSGADVLFCLTTIDGRRLAFSATTGAIVAVTEAPPDEHSGSCFDG